MKRSMKAKDTKKKQQESEKWNRRQIKPGHIRQYGKRHMKNRRNRKARNKTGKQEFAMNEKEKKEKIHDT
jgi:hypothetical protein